MAGTVLDNVTLGSPAAPTAAASAGGRDASEAGARAALDLVGGSGIRLDAVVDARGGGLSGGQAQRVAAARAVYRARELDCPVVVFDEPTSALDEGTEADFVRGLRVLAGEGRVVLVVSHRRAVIDAADQVIRFAAREVLVP